MVGWPTLSRVVSRVPMCLFQFVRFNKKIAMATASGQEADDGTISVDLADFLNPNQEELAELEKDDFPDSDLCTLMVNVSEDFGTVIENNVRP